MRGQTGTIGTVEASVLKWKKTNRLYQASDKGTEKDS
jgi:hypothetical protein